MPIIYPDALSTSAVFPQCVDNQYVSPKVFDQLCADPLLDFRTPEIAEQRLSDVKSELIRSVLYSSQVVLNRAFMLNNNLLYDLYKPDSGRYSKEFIQLVNQGVIVPFLFKYFSEGSELRTEDLLGEYQVANAGIEACAHLLDNCDNGLTVLALARTEEDLNDRLMKISLGFETRLDACFQTAFQHESLLSKMFANVYPNSFMGKNSEDIPYTVASELFLDSLRIANDVPSDNRYSRSKGRRTDPASRNQVYNSFLITQCKCGKGLDHKDCQCVTNGRYDIYTDQKKRRATFGAKSMVDLVYSTVVPDLLHRFVFTPRDLPSRKALQDLAEPETMGRSKMDDVAKLAQAASRNFHATANEAFVLPDLTSFEFSDVLAIREFDEWQAFIQIQNQILNDPIESVNRFEDFQDAFAELQNAISKYFKNHMLKRKDIRSTGYYSFVSGAITILGDVVRIGLATYLNSKGVSDLQRVTIDRVLARVLEFSKDTIAVGPARIMFEFMDVETREVKRSMSWSVDWMSKQVEWEKKDLIEFLKENKDKNKEAIVAAQGMSNIGEN